MIIVAKDMTVTFHHITDILTSIIEITTVVVITGTDTVGITTHADAGA
jgi:hypothetical protein